MQQTRIITYVAKATYAEELDTPHAWNTKPAIAANMTCKQPLLVKAYFACRSVVALSKLATEHNARVTRTKTAPICTLSATMLLQPVPLEIHCDGGGTTIGATARKPMST